MSGSIQLDFNIIISFSICTCALFGSTLADVAHFHPQEFGLFHHQHQQQQQQQHHLHPFQLALQPAYPAPTQSPLLSALYGVPTAAPADDIGYPQPVTHSPVAPTVPSTTTTTTATSTTEFTLPEIVENRSFRQQQQQHHHFHNFIPLSNQYLPPPSPSIDHPIYESPGYHYPRPTNPSSLTPTTTTTTSSTTTTTTERPPQRPIVVVEPPLADNPIVVGGSYDYNAPPGPAFTLPPPVFRPSTPAPAYLPPATANEVSGDAAVVEHLDPNMPPLRLTIQEMRCMQQSVGGGSTGGGYFRSVLKVNSFIGATPSVEDSDVYDKRCEAKLSRSYVVLDLAETDFGRCGVRTCGKDLCLRLRFPAIRGMRTGWDAILTLHCKTQDRVAVKTHALKMGVTNEAQARSLGTYARGGAQNQFRTHVELLHRNSNSNSNGNVIGNDNGGYTRLTDTTGGNAVQLGEELLLRAHVVPGDGWNYTKLSDVSLQRISAAGELLNSANLVTTNGCLNPSMQSICTQPPTYEAPLGHRLIFRAVMFQGMRSGDELVLAMRITGCLEANDCYVNAHDCNDLTPSQQQRRRRRNAEDALMAKNGTAKSLNGNAEISEVSRIAFRVLLPATDEVPNAGRMAEPNAVGVYVPQRTVALVGSLVFVASLCCVGLLAMWKLKMH